MKTRSKLLSPGPMNPKGETLSTRRPLICLVTDRQRLSPGVSLDCQVNNLVGFVTSAAEAGIGVVQVRERDLSGRILTSLVSRCVEATAGSATHVVVNDRADVALASGAAGVHLREDSVEEERARTLGPPAWLVSRAVHDPTKVLSMSSTLDYLVFGSVFLSPSKPMMAAPAGIGALGRVISQTGIPVLAIGGVCEGRLKEVWRTGAAGFAGIGLFIESARLSSNWTAGLTELVQRARQSFDSVGPHV